MEISQYDKMTKTPVSKLVVKLGIPTTISMLVTSFYNLADTAFVGQLGTSASGAIGVSFGFMSIIQAFGFMYGQGAGSIISRMLGRKDAKSASKIASTSFFVAIITGIIISLLGFLFLEPMIYALGSSDTIFPYAVDYLKYILIAAPFMMASFTLNNILRFEGKAAFAMIGLLTGAFLNIAGDPLLIFVFDMGIGGAGLATAISQIVSFLILLSIFLMGKTETKISFKNITKKWRDLFDIVATGVPALIRQGFASVSTILLNSNARVYGDAAVAAMSIVNRITMFVFSIGLGLSQGFQPVCGFNFGAGKYKRVRDSYRFTIICSEFMIAALATVVFILTPTLITLFRDDVQVIEIGTFALRVQCAALLLHPVVVATNMMFQSIGQKILAAFTAILRNGLCFVPLIIILPQKLGLFGIQIAQSVADVLTFIILVPLAFYIYGKLKKLESEKGTL